MSNMSLPYKNLFYDCVNTSNDVKSEFFKKSPSSPHSNGSAPTEEEFTEVVADIFDNVRLVLPYNLSGLGKGKRMYSSFQQLLKPHK